MKIGWLLGWATPEAWFAPLAREAFPTAEHVFIAATPHAWPALEAAAPYDWLAGYSLGTLLLLNNAERATRLGRVALLAPVFAFTREDELGGRVARAQVRYLARWLRRNPVAALADFYERAGLVVPLRIQPDVSADDLLWGLGQLENVRIPPVLPEGWRAWCGDDDALLDAARLCALVPEVQRVPGGTHHPRSLLQAFVRAAQ